MTPQLPPTKVLDLPGRGRMVVRDTEGPPGAPALLLLHGWTVSADLNWFPVFDALGQRYRIVSFDHRGHGRCGIRSHEPFTLETCADDAAAVVEALGLARVVAVGYSMGGLVAQLLWRRRPDLVASLVLCSTATNFAERLVERLRFALIPPTLALARLAREQRSQAVYNRVIAVRTRDRNYHPWVVDELLACDARHMLEAGAAIGRFDSRPWIGSVDVPVSVIVTEPDTVVPSWRQRALVAAIPGAHMAVAPGDHDVIVSRPNDIVPLLGEACDLVCRRARLPAAS